MSTRSEQLIIAVNGKKNMEQQQGGGQGKFSSDSKLFANGFHLSKMGKLT